MAIGLAVGAALGAVAEGVLLAQSIYLNRKLGEAHLDYQKEAMAPYTQAGRAQANSGGDDLLNNGC